MGERQIAYAAVVAAPTSGALCALAYLLDVSASPTSWLGPGAGELVLTWLLAGAWYGAAFGVLCGILPGILAVALWPTLVARFGVRGGILVLSVVVGAIGAGEVAASGVTGEAWPWAAGAGVVCAVTSAAVLLLFSRRAEA